MKSLRMGVAVFAIAQVALAMPVLAQKQQARTPFVRGCEQMMKKDFTAALTSFSEAISDDANDVNSYFRRGQSFFCLGNYNEAIRDFGHAAEKGAMDPNLYLWTGTAYAKLGKDADAIVSYEKAMRLNPKLAAAGAESKAENGQPVAESSAKVEDTAKVDSIAKVESVQAGAVTKIASTTRTESLSETNIKTSKPAQTLSLGTSQNALDDYKIAAKNVLENASGAFVAGVIYSGIVNQGGRAIDLGELEQSKENQSSDKSGRVAKRDAAQLKAELRELNDQINAQPQNAKLFFRRARVQLLLENNPDGLEDLNRAIDLDKTCPHFYLARAFYFYQHDDEKAADRDIRRAQELNPIIPNTLSFETTKTPETKGKL